MALRQPVLTLSETAAARPDHPAVIMTGSNYRLSFADLDRQSIRIARLLHDAGLQPGDRVAVLLENRADYFSIAWAARRSGFNIVPIMRPAICSWPIARAT